jgi:hypothetical protein
MALIFMVSQAFALEVICTLVTKAMTMTSFQMKQFRNEIKAYRIEGNGEVDDVYELRRDSIVVVVRCDSDVIVHLIVKDYSGITRKKLNIGQKISFRGNCRKLEKKFYHELEKQFIRVTVGNGLLVKY